MNTVPKDNLAIPSTRQLAWHEKPFYGFVHFGPNTFTDREWGLGDEDPSVFAPTALDCRQWARAARDAGMARLILTAKHHDGFCLWPSKWTTHSVRSSSWRDGHGDVVREFSEACAAEGIEAGLYLSPWDRNHAEYGREEYRDYYLRQLEELFTQYGELTEIWFDGANGGDGYYGGAREKRSIDQKSYYPWAEIAAARDRWQPRAVMFGNIGYADLRWVGNEAGKATDPSWASFHEDWAQEDTDGRNLLEHGAPLGEKWKPAEVDVSIRERGHWFHHDEDAPLPLDQLVHIWKNSVGRGMGLILNIPPTREGLFRDSDVQRMMELRAATDAMLAQVADGDSATIALPPGKTAGGVLVEEDICQGQRVTSFAVMHRQTVGDEWREVASAQTIGRRRYLDIPSVTGGELRLEIRESFGEPSIAFFKAVVGRKERQ